MRSSVQVLERDIAEIQAMASSITPVNELLRRSSDPTVSAYLSVRRRFDYSALIVALYASFERFVEDIISIYAQTLARRGNYSSLPTGLIRKHLNKSAELLGRAIDNSRYPGVSHLQLVENLFMCLSGNSAYSLNHPAIIAHDQNLRYNELGSLLTVVELTHEDVRRAGPLLDWYRNEQGLAGVSLNEVPQIVVRQRLDNLVERRNDIAHRGGNPTERLGGDEIRELVDFILALAHSVFTVFVAGYFGKHHVGSSDCAQLERTEGPYEGQRVWVVKPPSLRLYVSQPIFALSAGFLARWGRVESLRIDGVDHTSIEPGGDKDIGVKFGFATPKTARLFVLAQEDELIWPAAAGGSSVP
jgi:hypothetical protein